MGVFFTQKKEYDRALTEFQRALDFDPTNAKVLYNLGYLCAEHFENHEKAVEYFKRYLQLSPSSKESEAIKSYVLVRQAYTGPERFKDMKKEF